MWTYIVFRDTAAGRTAFVEGTGLAVWEIMMIARCYGGDTARTAQHLEIPEALVRAAINDRDAFPSEVDGELAENDAMNFEALQKILPNIQRARVLDEPDTEGESTETT